MTQETKLHFTQYAGTVDDLMIELYDELRSLAAKYLQRESRQLLLEPAALVHESLEDLDRLIVEAHGFRQFAPLLDRDSLVSTGQGQILEFHGAVHCRNERTFGRGTFGLLLECQLPYL